MSKTTINDRILQLQDERIGIQTRTFKNWANSYLNKAGANITDLEVDFCSGQYLLLLLEQITGKQVPKQQRGRWRIHNIANVNAALAFIKNDIRLESIGAEDIVDGNLKLILGMMWSLIWGYMVHDIDEDGFTEVNGLLVWCQNMTDTYKNINVQNFHMSFKDGLVFCALIHRHNPDLIDYHSLSEENPLENLNTAFNVAEKHLNIPRMLEPDDLIKSVKPDEKSVITYVSAYYHALHGKQQADTTDICIQEVQEVDIDTYKQKDENERVASDEVSESILTKLCQLNKDDFKDLVALGTYASYENTVYLAGPCNIGKSSLASILIGEPIVKTWVSTDGLTIHFGRNGIDLHRRMMVPLKRESGDILTKLLLGNPELRKQKELSYITNLNQTTEDNRDVFTEVPLFDINRGNELIHSADHQTISTDYFIAEESTTPPQISSDRDINSPLKPGLDILESCHNDSVHTADSIQANLLEKLKQGSYLMDIAPSDLVDFGGQKSFDMTHQLFIQHKGTFILMFDGRKGLFAKLEEYPHGDITAASILEHWVHSVLTYCDKSDDNMPRVMFAATHSDEFSEEEKERLAVQYERELAEMFSSHRLHRHIMYNKVFFINATDADDLNIDQLKDTLVDIAFQQSTWGRSMPIVWVPLDLQISDMRADGVKLITKERLLEINKSNNEFALSEKRMEDFLLIQHSIGKVLYFEEPALKDFIVIQPAAMVNILRAFITDTIFWPREGPIRNILDNLSTTGSLKKTDLFALWSQPAFKEILIDERTKEYVIQVLLHLDILVEPKRYTERDTAAELFLVPCIVKENMPTEMQQNATDDRTICIAYQLKDTTVPSAFSFKVIGATISNWPLKVVDYRYCLYYKSAVIEADHKNELQIHVDGQKIFVYLINDVSKKLISPDLATTTQECLTLALGRILQFYRRSFGKQEYQSTSDLLKIEVGEMCNGKSCLIPLSDAKKQTRWRCKNGKIHETKFLLNWFIDKNKEQCDPKCKGLERETLLLRPNDQHFVQLARKIGIEDFYNFFIHLGMEKADYENLNFRYFTNPMDFMLMGLFEWRDKTDSDQSTATFGKLLEALTAIERQHYLCQVNREDHSLVEKAHSRLQKIPSDHIIDMLTEKKLIGDCVVHLGVELGLSICNIKETMHNFPRDMNGQINDLLVKWKNWGKYNKVKPTIYRLMTTLKHVKASEGLEFLKKSCSVE